MADLNGDGAEEIYLSGATGTPGVLYTSNAEGKFRPVGQFVEGASFEDMGCLFFDADGDDDLDLYVVSGGYESGEKPELLQDRLYISQNGAAFELSEDAIASLVR